MSKKNKNQNPNPVPEDTKDGEQGGNENKAEDKPNIFKRMWSGIKHGFEVVKENIPAATIGAVLGTAATLGVGYILNRSGSDTVDTSDDAVDTDDEGYDEEYDDVGPGEDDE